MLQRYYRELQKYIKQGKVLIIYGPRQVGKTTLLNDFLSRTPLKYRLDSGDNITVQEILSSQDFSKILEYAEGLQLLVIDEAQNVKGIGTALKILVDQVPQLSIIATGSSSFDLAQNIGEPLTGRKNTLTLFPLAQLELKTAFQKYDLRQQLENFMIFGSYPAVLTAETKKEKIQILRELVDSYLLKDILTLEHIKKSETLFKLVKLLAFQVGQLVSFNELATQLHIDVKTVARYLDLLEKAFIIRKLGGFSKNLRNEITSKHKYYFVDNGIRNGVIAQFNPLENRDDVGQLWENFFFMERIKKCSYTEFYGEHYFWRTYEGQEIDFIEEIENQLIGYEAKWSPKKKFAIPSAWKESYPHSPIHFVTKENYFDFIL